jgi:uncharacterized protein YegP (UPF0339 family)
MAEAKSDRYADRIEVYPGQDKQWYYRGKSSNGETLYTSEGYTERAGAVDAATKAASDSGISVEVEAETN